MFTLTTPFYIYTYIKIIYHAFSSRHYVYAYAVWTAHCLNREKFENGEKTTRKLYAHQRGKTALHVLEHSLDGLQQVHTEFLLLQYSKVLKQLI